MDSSDLFYVTYDAEEMWAKMTDAYIDAGGRALYAGNEKEIMLRAVQQILMQAFAGMDNGIKMATLRYAVRDYLEEVGEERYCPYLNARPATSTVTITFRSTGIAETIPAGETVTADGVTLYTLDEDVEDTGAARSVTAAVTCSRSGAAGNALLSGAQMQFMLQHDGVESVVCAADASGGQDAEDYEAYRARVRAQGPANVTTGTVDGYRSRAMAVSSVILDAAPLRTAAGSVCCYLLLGDEAGSAALIAAVEEALNPQSERPLTDNVSVALAVKVKYTLNVKCYESPDTSIAAAAGEAVARYRVWQDQTIGRAFNPDKLKSLLYEAGAVRVIWEGGSAFDDGGDVDYTPIDANEVCSGTINLVVVSA